MSRQPCTTTVSGSRRPATAYHQQLSTNRQPADRYGRMRAASPLWSSQAVAPCRAAKPTRADQRPRPPPQHRACRRNNMPIIACTIGLHRKPKCPPRPAASSHSDANNITGHRRCGAHSSSQQKTPLHRQGVGSPPFHRSHPDIYRICSYLQPVALSPVSKTASPSAPR